MSRENENNELEEILKKVRENHPELQPEDELLPPKTADELQREAQPQQDESEEAPSKAEEDKPKKTPFLRPKLSVIKANFKTRLLPRVTAFFKSVLVRRVLLALAVLAVLVGACFGGVKMYEYSKVAYLKPYEQKYGIEYPQGIREEYCDDYGKDQTFAGRLVIEDAGVDVAVAKSKKGGTAVMEYGGTVLQKQHLRSVALPKDSLETQYATAQAYVNAGQRVVFKTLFGDEEYKVVAAYYANTDPDKDSGYVFPYNAWGNLTKRSYQSYIDRVNTRSLYLTGNRLDYADYYLSVNMPTGTQEDARFVLLCRRVEKDESFEKTETTKENKRIHHTQAWYDEHGEQNPYRLAADWYPEIYTDAALTKTKQLTAEDFK